MPAGVEPPVVPLVESLVGFRAVGPDGVADVEGADGRRFAAIRRHSRVRGDPHHRDLSLRNFDSAITAAICSRTWAASPAREPGNIFATAAG